MDAAVRDQLIASHPNQKLYFIRSPDDGIEIVVTGAPSAVWMKYRSMTGNFSDPAQRAMAQEMLVQGSIVYPEWTAFSKELSDRKLTGFYEVAAEKIRLYTGVRMNVESGEL